MDKKVRGILIELRRLFGAIYGGRLEKIILFGSQARGEAEAGSDIDVLVVLHGPVRPGQEIRRTSETTAALSLKYGTVVSCTFVAADRYATEQSPLLLNARRVGVTV